MKNRNPTGSWLSKYFIQIRDLAIALARRGKKEDFKKSIQLLVKVVENSWDIRFDQIELICMQVSDVFKSKII